MPYELSGDQKNAELINQGRFLTSSGDMTVTTEMDAFLSI
jgi:hypothetical protein